MAKPSSLTGRPTGSERSSSRASARRRKALSTSRKLFDFDLALGSRFVAGVDEAGRGSLAGPLVAAAVSFDYHRLNKLDFARLAELNDSKLHTHETREELLPLVLAAATRVSVSSYSATLIDANGLHKTNLLALRDSLERVAVKDCVCLIDGFELRGLRYQATAVIDGDARSAAIAAASVVAKVTRDRFMKKAEKLYPGWGFAAHVGYSTPEHRAAINTLGVSPLHRLSFRSVAYQQLALDRAA